jgi:hypothetical protein
MGHSGFTIAQLSAHLSVLHGLRRTLVRVRARARHAPRVAGASVSEPRLSGSEEGLPPDLIVLGIPFNGDGTTPEVENPARAVRKERTLVKRGRGSRRGSEEGGAGVERADATSPSACPLT